MKLSGKLAFKALMITAIFFNHPVHAQETKNGLTWYTDVKKAYEISQQTKKPIFGLFTGSDWCIWCHRLDENVFDKPGFKEWAKKNVVLLELDFPRYKKLPDEVARQNDGLQQFFKVQGYPIVWMFYMDKDKGANKFKISALGSLGYPRCEPGKEEVTFLGTANDIIKRKNKSLQ